MSRNKGLEVRYEASERELFSRINTLGRDVEKNVLNDRQASAAGAEGGQQAKGPVYGSAEHRAALGRKIQGTGTDEEIHGRLVAAADQGAHPREATRRKAGGSTGARRSPAAASVRERAKGAPNR